MTAVQIWGTTTDLAKHIAEDHGLIVEGDEARAELEEAHRHLHGEA